MVAIPKASEMHKRTEKHKDLDKAVKEIVNRIYKASEDEWYCTTYCTKSSSLASQLCSEFQKHGYTVEAFVQGGMIDKMHVLDISWKQEEEPKWKNV